MTAPRPPASLRPRASRPLTVLVTPTPRLDFSNGAFQNGFLEYCAAIKELGAETDTRVIDLQTKGLAYYTSIGLEEVGANISLDVLHFKVEGAFQMARLVAEGVKESDLPIAAFCEVRLAPACSEAASLLTGTARPGIPGLLLCERCSPRADERVRLPLQNGPLRRTDFSSCRFHRSL